MNLTALAARRFAGRLWAIAPARLESLLGGIGTLGIEASSPCWLPEPVGRSGYTVTESGIAVVPVLGPLVSRGDWLTALFGASEYGAIAEAVRAAAADPVVRGIVLEIDSPGGEVGGLFDLVDGIGAIRQRSTKPLRAVASEAALSAAYAIASVADRLYVTRTGEVGSVGVVAVHVDESAADAMAGLKWTLVHAGARKTDGNPHEPLSPRAATDIQADVDTLYDALVAVVAGNRGFSADAVRSTEAAIYRGERAVEVGLADRVGTVAQAVADLEAVLATEHVRAGTPANRTTHRHSAQPARTCTMSNPDPVIDENGATPTNDDVGKTDVISEPPEAENETPPEAAPADRPHQMPVSDAQAIADRLRGEFSEIATVAAQAARLGIEIDAADAMRRGLKPDALRRSILDTLAARSDAADVVAIAPQPATTGDSPIIKRARERAAVGSC